MTDNKKNTGNWNTGYSNTGDSNTGYFNTGNRNTGDSNTGYRNTGDSNTGDSNTGDSNTGYRNTGDSNTGDSNTGDSNTGDSNTGDSNTGYRNTGDSNTGDSNTGDSNTGYSNTGNWNTGDRNTGNWNTGDRNTGYFNTNTPDTIRAFGKEVELSKWESIEKPNFLYFNLIEWISEFKMTDQEKTDNPTFFTTGGYLKKKDYKEAFKESWNNANKEDRSKVFNLPNFNADIFLGISGIDVREDVKKEITIDGKTIEISEESFKDLKRSLLDD